MAKRVRNIDYDVTDYGDYGDEDYYYEEDPEEVAIKESKK